MLGLVAPAPFLPANSPARSGTIFPLAADLQPPPYCGSPAARGNETSVGQCTRSPSSPPSGTEFCPAAAQDPALGRRGAGKENTEWGGGLPWSSGRAPRKDDGAALPTPAVPTSYTAALTSHVCLWGTRRSG